MKLSDMGPLVALMTTVTLAFAGCGGQPQGQSTFPEGLTAVRQVNQHGKSGSGDLIYAAAIGKSYVLTYPQGKLVGTISVGALDSCSDDAGNVFLAGDQIEEFAHGGTSPIATFSTPGSPSGCAVDPTSGNLAVVFARASGNDVAVFPNASGSPTLYDSNLTAFWCGYDNQGNLFVDGEGQSGASLVELAKNAQSFETLSIAPHIEGVFLRIQWDGSYLTVEAQSNYKRGTHHAVSVNRLSISGSAATVVGTTQIKTIRKTAALSWIDGDRVLVPYGNAGRYNPNIGYWKYTAGGAPVTRVEKPAGKTAIINAITISKGS
ncbi:MAG: hypothetical protein WCE97_10085 [Candidatus Cybelea sp.]